MASGHGAPRVFELVEFSSCPEEASWIEVLQPQQSSARRNGFLQKDTSSVQLARGERGRMQ